MSSWRILADKAHFWKGHFVPIDLLGKLEDDLVLRAKSVERPDSERPDAAPRAPDFVVSEPTAEEGFFVDHPGMVMLGRRIREVLLDGFRVAVPSQDWVTILADIRLAAERQFGDGTLYYKIHGLAWCLVLTPELRDALITGMEAQLADAEREGDEDDEEFARRINRANEHFGGKMIVSKRAEAINAAKNQDNKKTN